jgi:hypothetical protein
MKLRDHLTRLREWFKPRQMQDAVFGLIAYSRSGRGVWTRDAATDRYEVRVFAGEDGPSDDQRALFIEFQNRRPAVMALVEQSLLDEYNTVRDYAREAYEQAEAHITLRFNEEFPKIERTSDIWTIARLAVVEVMGDGKPLDLCLTFDMDWGDPEHDIRATIKDWTVVDVAKEG